MGKIYGKYLHELGIKYNICDPLIKTQFSVFRQKYTHVIISSPTNTHADNYRLVRNHFSCPILIEKPVVDRIEDLYILNDPFVFCGMCERFNLALHYITENFNLRLAKEIEIWRYCDKKPDFDGDLLIHDLDILYYYFNNLPARLYYRIYEYPNYMIFGINGNKIEVNLTSQEVRLNEKIVFVNPNPFTIKPQLINFLNGGSSNSLYPHFDMLSHLRNKNDTSINYEWTAT